MRGPNKMTVDLDSINGQLLHLAQCRFYLGVELSISIFVSNVFGEVADGVPKAILLVAV